MKNTREIMLNAWKNKLVIPAFNIPYLPMMEPVALAVKDENSFALIEVARLEWIKFQAKSLDAVKAEYDRYKDIKHLRLHLDHIPVVDEDNLIVDYMADIKNAVTKGFESVMVDGSRLTIEENIKETKKVCDFAHANNLPCEAELGSITGHESGPQIPYDELYNQRIGFTQKEDAERFAKETGCDWLSVAIGNFHGAISKQARGKEKPSAKLNIQHLAELNDAAGIPLVLHGGSGIEKRYIEKAIENGIAKINVAAEIRNIYENSIDSSDEKTAQENVYKKTRELIKEFFEVSGSANVFRADK